ncbi:PLP-dependent aminotransferase family protein [Dasania marina]|uniref:MocR-like pyridoxine biosynthesis transcription factor PdxR n=1 Tax=Dasania marina TaxID=471499 RepID=UPI0030DAF19D|tara:strand:- start:40132 stop:41964 length:1833 start_codon:yes stop_codon:yes gene_type:complete
MTTSNAIIYLDPDSELNLQSQIRQKLVEAISLGTFPIDRRLPSSRKLAEQLGVARNTVVLVYQQLIDEEYLVSRERSGIYVNGKVLQGRVGFEGRARKTINISAEWQQRLKTSVSSAPGFSCPPNWQQYPYPFIDGQFDTSLYPIKEWREASRLALGVREIYEWAGESGDADDPMLIEQIRTKILPRRGIQAGPDEILITVGTQQALYLAAQLLVDSSSTVAIEEPGYPDMRQLLVQRGASLVHQPVDTDGMLVDQRLDTCQLMYVTPSHQTPTAVTMSMQRRTQLLEKARSLDQLIIEDDYEFESNYLGNPHPALRGIDKDNRVIYASCLSKVLAPGVRLGFMVAAPELIAEARKLRRLMVLHPPLNNQRTVAYFLSLGYYDTFLMHLYAIFQKRWMALRYAVNYYLLHDLTITPSQGGTSFWMTLPSDLTVQYLVQEAAKRGILIEPMDHYYATENVPENSFRMGVTSIPHDKIRDGVVKLRELIHELRANTIETFTTAKGTQYVGEELRKRVSDTTMRCLIAYGDPCTIDLHADGSMTGRAGYANEDCDTGRWWVEGDYWYRQWQRWAWAEIGVYHVKLERNHIKLFDEQGYLIENALLKKSKTSKK